MYINSGTNSIADEARFMAKASSTDLPIADVVRLANQALDRLNSLVLGVETVLQFDDPNHGNLPVGTFAFSANQNAYTIQNDGGSNSILGIDKIVLPNGNGGYQTLTQFNMDSYEGSAFLNQTYGAGLPVGFTLVGSTVYLHPTPNYSGTATIYFRRNVKYFTTSDTSVAPGFAAPFHRLVPLWIAYWYCVREGKTSTATQLMNEIQMLEDEFVEYYGENSGNRIVPEYLDPR